MTKKINPWAFVPGAGFWGCVGVYAMTGDEQWLGAAFAVLVVALGIGAIVLLRRSAKRSAEIARVWHEGVRATARVVSISTMGSFNDHPRVQFELDILPSTEGDAMLTTGREPYRVQVTAVINQLAVPRIQPDSIIHVAIDPEERSRVAVDGALVYPGYAAPAAATSSLATTS
ncbi:MAG: hypothetical protein AAFS10_01660 [Myxococcota bacterium]